MVIIIHAHLANIANPGTFDKTVKTLLQQNNLLEVNLPDDASSAETFRLVSAFPGDDLRVTLTKEDEQVRINANFALIMMLPVVICVHSDMINFVRKS